MCQNRMIFSVYRWLRIRRTCFAWILCVLYTLLAVFKHGSGLLGSGSVCRVERLSVYDLKLTVMSTCMDARTKYALNQKMGEGGGVEPYRIEHIHAKGMYLQTHDAHNTTLTSLLA